MYPYLNEVCGRLARNVTLITITRPARAQSEQGGKKPHISALVRAAVRASDVILYTNRTGVARK